MYTEKLETIRARIKASRMKAERKEEFLKLLNDLSEELSSLPANSQKEAGALVELANQSSIVALDDDNYPLKEMEFSLKEFEVNYPNLVRIINRICVMFANTGI